VGQVRRRLRQLGRGDEDLESAFEMLADIHLSQLPTDPECKVLSPDQLRHRQRRESALFDTDQATADEVVQRVEDAAEVERVLAAADLTREERAAFVLGQETTNERLAAAFGCSVPTVERRRSSARRKIDQVTGRFTTSDRS